VAPAVDLTGSFLSAPMSVSSGNRFTATFLITNSAAANVAAVGVLPFDIDTSPDGKIADAVVLKSGSSRIRLAPGQSIRITITATISASSFLVVNLDPGNSVFTDDVNPGNNSFATASMIVVA